MIPILYQDENFVVVDKPALMLSVPGRFQDDPRPIVGRELEKEIQKRIFPVHRLDFEVSGVMLFALNPEAHRAANSAFEKREVRKVYQARTPFAGFEVGQTGIWKAKILRGKKRAYENKAGQLAITKYEVKLKTQSGHLDWHLFPETGRPHQLRWEMYRHECPILGDALYGSQEKWEPGIALRAIKLEFSKSFCQDWKLPDQLLCSPFPDHRPEQKP